MAARMRQERRAGAGRPAWLLAAVLLLLMPGTAQGGPEGAQGGTASLAPGRVMAARWTSLTLVYRAGPGGMAAGGGIQVQFPKSWHPWLPVARPPQTTDPAGPYYATAATSAPGGSLGLAVANAALDGRRDRLDWTVTITLANTALAAGETITYTLGDTSQGGAGVLACATAMTEVVRVAEDPEGDGTFLELAEPLVLTIAGLPADRLMAYAPGYVQAGTPFRLLISAQDNLTNLAGAYTGTIHLTSTDPLAELPGDYTLGPGDAGRQVLTVTLHSTGTHYITAADPARPGLGRQSNPIHVGEGQPALRLYWGDLHVHSDASKDGAGPPAQALRQARDVLGLNFGAVTDHVDYPASGLSTAEWLATQALVGAYHQPGRFVPILAYEWSMPAPYGHHNVYQAGDSGPLCYLDACDTLDGLWAGLPGDGAFTIAHHTGIRWGSTEHTADWSGNDPVRRPAIEIYSVHGQSEYYNPEDPLSYEQRQPGWAESVAGPHYARDAWAAGQRIGVVAGSDNHDVRPGMPWNGLTAVYAPELSRDALLDAIRARHTYATTGERILLEFRLGEAMMGDEVMLRRGQVPVLSVSAAGTAEIEWVELLRFDGLAYSAVYSATPPMGGDGRRVAFEYTDAVPPAHGLYYVRLQQTDPNKPDRPARAWSSPIWVDRAAALYLPLLQRAGGH